MKAVFVLAIFLLVGSTCSFTDLEYEEAFLSWLTEYAVTFTEDELSLRFNIFKGNMDFVSNWNAMNTSTVVGLNQFACLSNDEFISTYLGTFINATDALDNTTDSSNTTDDTGLETRMMPRADTVDWRTKGCVTPVQDQGQCGSDWAFSATGAIEGAYCLKIGSLVSLSEQNLMDCSSSYGNQGCNGGLMDKAFKYVIANNGIDTEASYPYIAKNGACRFTAANVGATISGYKTIAPGSESSLTVAVNARPVSVAIDASHNSFQLYKSGLYYEPQCSSSHLDFGCLVVGYGSDANGDYYIVKGSWGTSWGIQGYIHMARNRNNHCGIATAASSPVV